MTVFETDYWNTHVRLSKRRSVNGVLIRSLGNPALNAARDAVIGRAGPIDRRMTEARSSSWSLARAIDLRPEDLAGRSWAGETSESWSPSDWDI